MVSGLADTVGELTGTFAWAVSGALTAVRREFDMFGIAVLACVTAFGGGVIRDVIIGHGPPAVFTDESFLWVSLLGAAVIFCWHPPGRLIGTPLLFADAIGLGLFCVLGTVKAHQNGIAPVPAALLGMLTASGGGVLRDLLSGQTPQVLRWEPEMYAVPALAGAAVTALLLRYGWYSSLAGALAALLACLLRLLSVRYHWRAPRALHQRSSRAGTPPSPTP